MRGIVKGWNGHRSSSTHEGSREKYKHNVDVIMIVFDGPPEAGKMRQMGFRPHVRGSAKNACDHPHGGGQSCTSACPTHKFVHKSTSIYLSLFLYLSISLYIYMYICIYIYI